ncbi:putative Ig domain-containing protein [Spirosoma rhododendri]|uniref:Uncharacterized protein n=1 Tax=Spirosoma rhododendri TaxID=2728024 RepID=A0A7L5DMQ8_9BACT|nr:putative Ig domain-containing protein [Spirosoma rhododendri]QJD78771.1 hypothetical protein HH216_10280 [Spirosoma rhododendri]
MTTASANVNSVTSATLGGNVTADGGATVTERGIVYVAGSGTPTTSNTKVVIGNGPGSFSQQVTNLTLGTTYTARAYAINSIGTSYGNNVTFTTNTTVTSIIPNGTSPANAGSVQFTVTFASSVAGITTSNFATSPSSGITGSGIASVSGSGTTYTVTVNTGSGNGTLGLTLANDTGITPSISNEPFTGTSVYTIDKTAPAAPVVTIPSNGSFVSTTTPTYVGVAEASSTVTVIIDGSSIGTTTANGSGNWSLTPPTALAQGSHTVRSTAADAVGNVSSSSNTNNFTVDSVRPGVSISSSAGGNNSITRTSPIPFTVTFSENVTGFVQGGLSVTGGTVSGFSGSGTTYTFNVMPTSSGTTVVVNVASNTAQDPAGNGNTAAPQFSITAAPTIVVSPATLPDGTVGVAYAQALTASGGTAPYPYAITAGALPAGLTLSSAGIISGTPTAGGSFTFQVTATDASEAPGPYTGVRSYMVTIAAPTITLSPTTLPAGTQGTAYSQAIAASGGTSPYTYAITAGALPAGLTLASNGTLSGTPTAGGSFVFTVTATDASAAPGPYSGAWNYTLTINAPTITLSPTTLPAGTVGAAYSQAITASGGTSPYTYAITAGALPAGLTLASNGTLSGTPSGGTSTFTVTARDASTGSGPYTGARGYTVTIAAPTITLSPASLPDGTQGTAYSQTFTALGGTTPYAYAITSGALPSGMSFSSGGTLSGTPTSSGTFNFRVTATDASAAPGPYSGFRDYSLTIAPQPQTSTPIVTSPTNGALINITTPTYTGAAPAGSTVTVYVDDTSIGTTTTTGGGNWNLTQPTALAQGSHRVRATAQLSGQAVSGNSNTNTFTVVIPVTVATVTPTAVTSSGATLGGNVTDAGAGTVSERGVVYVAGNGTPTTSDTKVIIGAGVGSFAQAVTNLTASTTYSVRAYAINEAGTSYGTTQTFSTGTSLSIGSVTPSAVCAGATISVAYTSSSLGTPLQLYLSGPSNTSVLLTTLASSQASGTITAAIPANQVAGQYSVYLSGGGTTSSSVNVTVNAIPPAPTVSGSVVYCQNGPASPLSATPVSGAGLNWYGTNAIGGVPSGTAPVPIVSIPGTINYYVSQTANNCESPRAVISVTVTPLPQAPSTTPVTVCQNTTPVSLATGVTASPGASLNWYMTATGGVASGVAPVPQTNAVGQITYYVSQVINGCEGPRAAIIFTVNPLPVAALNNDGPLSCAKLTVTLMAASVPGSSYRFSNGASQVSSSNIATVSMSGPYSVTVTDGNGCSSSAQTTVGSDQDNPQASLTNDGPLTCAKTTVTLTAGGNGSYRFSNGATQIGTSNLATVNTGGVYSVTVTATNGCSATAQTTVEVNTTVAAPTLTASALSTENTPISVTASGCSGTINWTATGGTGTANGSVYTFTQVGNYALTATCTVGTCVSPSAPSLTLQIRPGGFAISSVELVRCQLLDAGRGQYEISLTPQYSGLNGSPVSFGVTNELAATTAPGPYTLRLYTDNATITLAATQANAQATYRYNWLAACNSTQPAPNRPPVVQPIPNQVLVVGQPYQLDLTTYFSDPDGQTLTFTATGLPTGLQLSGSRISGSPTQAGTSTVQVTALDPAGAQVVGSVVLQVNPAPVTPTPGMFSIAGVTGVRCETLSVGERRLSFSPVYTGLTGAPVSFGITNELAMTTAPGPYSLKLYTDNPVISLQATQGGTQASYRFEWLAACPTNPTTPPTGNRPPTVGTGLANQTAQVGQGFTLFIPAGTFVDPDNDQLQLSVSGLPTGLNFSAAQNAITGTPVQAGTSTIQVTATDPGGLSVSTSFVLTVQPAATTPTPTPGTFSIAGVTGVRCETLSVGERRLSFSPVYTGLTGAPVSFGVTNELSMTTAPGPYSLKLYTDNPTITLQATQGGTQASYRFEWLAACATSPNGRQAVAEAGSQLAVVVLGNPVVGESVEVAIRGVDGQSVELSLTDLAGNRLHLQRLPQVSADERVIIPVPTRQAMTILKVSTANQHQTVKLIRQ